MSEQKGSKKINNEGLAELGLFTHDYYSYFICKDRDNKHDEGVELRLFVCPNETSGGWMSWITWVTLTTDNYPNGADNEYYLPAPKTIADVALAWFHLTGDKLGEYIGDDTLSLYGKLKLDDLAELIQSDVFGIDTDTLRKDLLHQINTPDEIDWDYFLVTTMRAKIAAGAEGKNMARS